MQIPKSAVVHLTNAAEQYLSAQKHKAGGLGDWYMTLQRTGCSGLSYDLKLTQSLPYGAIKAFESGDYTIFLDEVYINWLNDLKIDIQVDGLGLKKLIFENANES